MSMTYKLYVLGCIRLSNQECIFSILCSTSTSGGKEFHITNWIG